MYKIKFESNRPITSPATVNEIKEIPIKGPWKTKSEAELRVLFSLPYDEIQKYLSYDQQELQNIPIDIRGLRSYSVTDLKEGSVGAMEFHRVRKEILFSLNGIIEVECEDVYKNVRNFTLNGSTGLFVPPFILHTYKVKRSGDIIVIANTLFYPDDSRTHDSYSIEIFKKLQENYLNIG